MRRMLFGLAIALASVAVSAGPAGAPVTVQNVPLPVTVGNTVPVTPAQAVIPFAKYDGLRAPIWCLLRRTTEPPGSFSESKTCTDATPVSLNDRFLIWNVIFEPSSAAFPLDDDCKAASCSAMYWLSIDGGATSQRIGMMTWSPGQFQSIVLPFPVPIEIPAGSAVVQRLDVTMGGGRINQGCNLAVSAIGAHQ